MKKNPQLARIVIYQNLGFVCLMAMVYFHDLVNLPVQPASDHPLSLLHRLSTYEMLFVLLVWLLLGISTRRILDRVRYLEKFMRVCSWCRRIHYQGRWMPLEEFMQQSFDTPTTHGICSDCLRQQQAAAQKAALARKSAGPST